MKRLVMLVLAAVALTTAPAGAALPPVKHVWLIQLENHSYDQTFNDANHPYLWTGLRSIGQTLPQFYATGHASLDNYITQISGQAPNPMTMADCPNYVDVTPGIMGTDGQVVGQGCVYPPEAKTLVDQLEAKGLTWKGYMEDMGNDPAREPATCGAPELNSRDRTQAAAANDQYAARHNPFVYFHSILDPPGRCAAHVGPLPPLASDLAKVATTPNFSWITPNLCNDGHDATPCAGPNAKGTNEGDLIAADAFLARWVPVITASKAFRQDGMLIITLDESSIDDASACCGEPAGLNTPMPGIFGPGGGRIGTLIASPYVQPGSVNETQYNHYSLLRSLENLYGISEHLGYAAMANQPEFGADVFNRPEGGPLPGVPELPAGDMGSTGTVRKLRVHVGRLGRRLRVRVRLTGTDRLVSDVQVRLKRHGRIVATSGRPRLLHRAHARLRLHRRRGVTLHPGRYRLVARALHEDGVVSRARRTVRVRR